MYDRYQGLIFDMDGTLLDTEPTHHKAWDQVLARYGMRYDASAMTALNSVLSTVIRPILMLTNSRRKKLLLLRKCCWIR